MGGSTERRRRPIQGRATTRTPVARPNSFRGKFLFWCLYISSHSVSAAVRTPVHFSSSERITNSPENQRAESQPVTAVPRSSLQIHCWTYYVTATASIRQ